MNPFATMRIFGFVCLFLLVIYILFSNTQKDFKEW